MSTRDPDFARCRELLPSVSRTFALTINVLPASLRDTITVAYLLCRIADTLEDATSSPPAVRIDGLEALAAALARPTLGARDLALALDLASGLEIPDSAGRRLLGEREGVFRAYRRLPAEDQAIVSRWVQAMALGMSTFVAREMRGAVTAAAGGAPDRAGIRERAGSSSSAPGPCGAEAVRHTLETADELRSYAYYVAGTVGHLLTDLFTARLGQKAASAAGRLRQLAVPFGLGLQFTNILQDLPEDRRRGWSYIPEEIARRHGTSARTLDDPARRQAALRVVAELAREAARYLDRALEFSLLLPRTAPRIRLFCLWPMFFAIRTLGRIWGEEQVVAGGEKVRITRREVWTIMSATSAACLSNGAIERLYSREQRRFERSAILRPF
jgi:farnesyl-diphosphate farnesyltransferase